MTLTAMAFPAQAQTINICDRTQQVVDEILRLTSTKDDACDSVSVSEMASISDSFGLRSKQIGSLKSGDFAGLTGVTVLDLATNELTELQTEGVLSLPALTALFLDDNDLSVLASDVFSNLPNLINLRLNGNSLRALPNGVFSGLTKLSKVWLQSNPEGTFQFTVRFEPETLEENFTVASVKVVLREGAPRPVTVPLLVFGGTLSANSLSLAIGGTESAAVTVTRNDGGGPFKLSQGKLRLGRRVSTSDYRGFRIVQGPTITVGGERLRIRVFLEGALE